MGIDWDLSPGRNRTDKKHYETKSTKRADFKETCLRRGWEFKKFKEIDSSEKVGTNKKYYYIETGEIFEPVVIIDTLKKWEWFQEKISKDALFYDRNNKGFINLKKNDEDMLIEVIDENLSLNYIEKLLNVDLKILKQ